MRYAILGALCIGLFVQVGNAQTWESLNDSLEAHYYNSNFLVALSFGKKAKKRAFDESGKYHIDYVESTKNVGIILISLGEYRRALVYLEEALILSETLLGAESLAYTECLNYLGTVQQKLGAFKEAEALFKEALSSAELSLGVEHAEYGAILNNLAILYLEFGFIKSAYSYSSQAVEHSKAFLESNPQVYFETVSTLLGIFGEMGKHTEALNEYKKILKIEGERLGVGHPSYGIHLKNIATLYQKAGDFEMAVRMGQRALKNCEVNLGRDHDEYALRLRSLSVFYFEIGKFDKSILLMRECLDIYEVTVGKKNRRYILALSDLGILYTYLGMPEMGLLHCTNAKEYITTELGQKSTYYSDILIKLGEIHQKMGDPEEALKMHLSAKENIEEFFDGENLLYGYNMNCMATTYQSLAIYDSALVCFQEALKWEIDHGADHAEYARIINNIAGLYMDVGNYATAMKLYSDALEIVEKCCGKYHSHYRDILENVAMMYDRMGQFRIAWDMMNECNDISQDKILEIFHLLSEKDKVQYLRQERAFFEYMQSMSLAHPENQLESWQLMEHLVHRNLVLELSKSIFRSARNSSDSTITERYSRWMELRNVVNRERSKPIAYQSPSLDSLVQRLDEYESELTTSLSDFSTLRTSLNLDFDKLRSGLGKESAYVVVSAFQYCDDEWTDTIKYVAYVIMPNKSDDIMLFLGNQIDFLNSQTDDPISMYKKKKHSRRGLGSRTLAASKFGLSLDAIASCLNGIDTVYITPSGMFNGVNMAALRLSSGGRLWDRYHVEMKSSVRHVLKRPKKLEDSINLVLFGGIEYRDSFMKVDSTQDCFNIYGQIIQNLDESYRNYQIESSSWPYLSGTNTEVQKISDIAISNGHSVRVLSGMDGSEDAFKALDGQSPQVLHLATHGFSFKAELKADSNAGPDNQVVTGQAYKLSEDPMMRSGLIMAGADRAWRYGCNPHTTEDGILTAIEISHLELSNTELVVLSACETGLGDIDNGEGVYGLQRAFKMAGVRYIIMSLWNVPDQETSQLMIAFYKNWLEKEMSLSDAFYTAQKTMAARYPRHPELWAGFVLVE